MTDEKKDEKSQEPPALPAEPPTAVVNPKIILQELEKSALAGEPTAVLEPIVSVESASDNIQTPLITDAMRRLDELLTRFRK